jgi:hypothetical protein
MTLMKVKTYVQDNISYMHTWLEVPLISSGAINDHRFVIMKCKQRSLCTL